MADQKSTDLVHGLPQLTGPTGYDEYGLEIKTPIEPCYYQNYVILIIYFNLILWSLSLRKKRTFEYSVLCAHSLAPVVVKLKLFSEKHKEENEDIIFIINQKRKC